MYDDFGMTDDVKSKFLSGNYNIGLFTFIYDGAGNLAASDSVYTQTFGKTSQEFKNIKEGEYTLITLEMLVDADYDYQSDNWVIVGKDKLSTLEIVNKNYVAYWYSAIGVATNKYRVEKHVNNSLDVTPKGIGSIIDTRMTNFDKSGYKLIALYTKNAPIGRYLNPILSGDERFHYDRYLGANVWMRRGYAYDETQLSSKESPTIYLIEEGRINYCFGAMKVDDNGNIINSFTAWPDQYSYVTLADGNRYYGGFHYLGNNLCDADMFNTYQDYKKWYDRQLKLEDVSIIDILGNTTVRPPLSTMSLPNVCTTWGASVRTVQTSMAGLIDYSMVEGTDGKAVYVGNNAYEIAYLAGKSSAICYGFTSETSGLFETDILYSKSMFEKEAIINYLNENYQFVTSQDDIYMYTTQDYKTIVMFFPHPENENVWNIGFVDQSYIAQSPVLAKNKALMNKAMSLKKQ